MSNCRDLGFCCDDQDLEVLEPRPPVLEWAQCRSCLMLFVKVGTVIEKIELKMTFGSDETARS